MFGASYWPTHHFQHQIPELRFHRIYPRDLKFQSPRIFLPQDPRFTVTVRMTPVAGAALDLKKPIHPGTLSAHMEQDEKHYEARILAQNHF
jgi:hypothetical protein